MIKKSYLGTYCFDSNNHISYLVRRSKSLQDFFEALDTLKRSCEHFLIQISKTYLIIGSSKGFLFCFVFQIFVSDYFLQLIVLKGIHGLFLPFDPSKSQSKHKGQ